MRLILLFLSVLICSLSYSQNRTNANRNSAKTVKTNTVSGPRVLGINIKNTKTKYNAELMRKGYKSVSKFGDHYEYKVTFAGYNDCKLQLFFNNTTDSITEVKIIFPFDKYKDIEPAENDIIKQLRAKYGKFSEHDFGQIYRMLGEDYHGNMNYVGGNGGCSIVLWKKWNSRSDRAGENELKLIYTTGVKRDDKVNVSDDL